MSQPQPEGLEDLEFCNCDPCVRAAEKEVIEAAAKQGLTLGAFPSGGWDAVNWIDDSTDGSTDLPSHFLPSTEDQNNQVYRILESQGHYEECPDTIRYRVSTGNIVKFGPGAAIEGVHLPPTRSIDVTGIPLRCSRLGILTALRGIFDMEETTSISDLRRARNSPHQTATIDVGTYDPRQIVSKLDGAELSGRNTSSYLFTAAYPNQMEDVSPTERNIVHVYWRAPEITATATFKTPESAIAWCEEHNYSVIDKRTIRARVRLSLMPRSGKVVEIGNPPVDILPHTVRSLLPDATSVSFHSRNVHDVERVFARLRKDVEAIAGDKLRTYQRDDSKVSSGWLGIRVQCYTWHAAQSIRDSLSKRRRSDIGGHRLVVVLEAPYRYSISIESHQYRAQRRLLHSLWDTPRGSALADILIIVCGPVEDVRVEVYGNNEPAVGVLKARVEGVLKGHLILGCHTFFGSSQKLNFIRAISIESGCFVRFDPAARTITAFGEDDALRAFIEELQPHIDQDISFKMKLTDSAVSASYLRRGIPLLASVVGKENVCVTIEHPHPTLTVRGGGDEVPHMLRWLCNEGIEDVESRTTLPDTMCLVCLNHPEASIRLECDHFYCYGCLKHFLKAGITDERPILACVKCLTPIPLGTLRKFLPHSELEDLFELAFSTYIRSNPEKFKFCGTPHCRRLYQVAPKDSQDPPAFRCPSCLRSICSACQGPPHEGMSCSGWEINQNAEVQKTGTLLEKLTGRKRKDVYGAQNGMQTTSTTTLSHPSVGSSVFYTWSAHSARNASPTTSATSLSHRPVGPPGTHTWSAYSARNAVPTMSATSISHSSVGSSVIYTWPA